MCVCVCVREREHRFSRAKARGVYRVSSNLKTAHTHTKKMEIIEILDSDEEGDERVRIVQQRHEPNLRPIQEEGNGDVDVIITGTRGG